MNLGEMLGGLMGGRTKRRKMSVGQSYDVLLREESDKLNEIPAFLTTGLQSVQETGCKAEPSNGNESE